jgi:hypothetical protein
MRSALVLAVVVILVAAGIGTGYEFGSANSHTETTTSTAVSSTTLTEFSTSTATVTATSGAAWKVVNQNATYTGPGCPPPALVFMALRIPCLVYTNSTTWNASLLLYNGKYFYAANETVGSTGSTSNSITYTVWFDNSTAYCVSPYLSASELPTCPPP